MAQRKDEVVESPAQLREAIAQARADLGAHLSALGNQVSPNPGDNPMPTQPKPKRAAAKSEKPAAKKEKPAAKNEKPAAKTKAAAKPSHAKKTSTAKGTAAKAGKVLDTMAAGAVVGAVKAAAQAIAQNEPKASKAKRQPTTGKVLGKMGPDAAVGAIVGAAQAVMPEAKPNNAKDKAPKKTTKGGAAARRK